MAVSLLMVSLPVRNALWLGQTSIIPVLLVLLGCFAVRGEHGDRIRRRADRRRRRLPADRPPLRPPLLWFTDRRRAAVSTGVTFLACTAVAWAAMAQDSYTYWVHHMAGVGLGGEADDLANQSLHGVLLRLGLSGPLEIACSSCSGAAVAVLALRRAVRYARDGQLLLAVAITGCAAVVVSPATWQHQLLWVLPALVGRVGKRASDRLVWPVAVVLVMTLPAKMILPNMAALYPPARQRRTPSRRWPPAVAVPFLSRTSPYFDTPVPTSYAPPVPTRFKHVPLLPFLRGGGGGGGGGGPGPHPPPTSSWNCSSSGSPTPPTPRSASRRTGGSNSAGRARAEEHGRQILDIERFLQIDIEHAVNHAVVKIGWLRDFFDFYYTSFHFIVPLAVLGVLYWRRPVDYRWARASLGFATLLALVGFWLYPLAPPRLMPGYGIIDTVHGVQDFSKPDYGTLTALTNKYAAMPSLHFGWSLWCGLAIAIVAPKMWMKALGLLHPSSPSRRSWRPATTRSWTRWAARPWSWRASAWRTCSRGRGRGWSPRPRPRPPPRRRPPRRPRIPPRPRTPSPPPPRPRPRTTPPPARGDQQRPAGPGEGPYRPLIRYSPGASTVRRVNSPSWVRHPPSARSHGDQATRTVTGPPAGPRAAPGRRAGGRHDDRRARDERRGVPHPRYTRQCSSSQTGSAALRPQARRPQAVPRPSGERQGREADCPAVRRSR